MKLKTCLAFGLMFLASAAFAGERGTPTGYKLTLLVSDQAGVAANTDPNLVDAWGLAQLSDSDPVWVADNGTNKSSFYNRSSGSLVGVVGISPGNPTGIVAVKGAGFDVKEGGKKGASAFIFDTESGAIEGWAPSVDFSNAIVAYDGSSMGSVYKGLALDPATNHLFAADFANNQVQIFDDKFKLIGSFTDTYLPKRYAPFNVAIINGNVYVAFAKRDKTGMNELHGAGLGYVDVFSTAGILQQQLIANGSLDAPWGMTIAPTGFGSVAGDLLVGNFGNGRINVYDPTSGAPLGTLNKPNGKPIVIEGLWALDNGPGSGNITFSAGPDSEAHGLLGLIAPQ